MMQVPNGKCSKYTMSMRDLAERALDAATRNGVTYADVRVEDIHERHITTKNAKPGTIATYKSMGRMPMAEVAVYQVRGGKIVHEQFFYG